MICSECKHMLPDDSEFCQYCGKRLEKHVSIQENSVVENAEEVIVTDEIIETVKPVLHNLEDTTPEKPVKSIIKIQTEETAKKLKENKKSRTRFCKMCGSQINSETKKCSGCGKQYLKGVKINKFIVIVIIFSVVILSSVILNIVQIVKMNELNEDNNYYKEKTSNQQVQISNLNKEIKEKNRKINFFDEHVVFVVNNGTRVYHKYDCYKFTGSYWAYNIEAAKGKGYSPCSICH